MGFNKEMSGEVPHRIPIPSFNGENKSRCLRCNLPTRLCKVGIIIYARVWFVTRLVQQINTCMVSYEHDKIISRLQTDRTSNGPMTFRQRHHFVMLSATDNWVQFFLHITCFEIDAFHNRWKVKMFYFTGWITEKHTYGFLHKWKKKIRMHEISIHESALLHCLSLMDIHKCKRTLWCLWDTCLCRDHGIWWKLLNITPKLTKSRVAALYTFFYCRRWGNWWCREGVCLCECLFLKEPNYYKVEMVQRLQKQVF